MSRPEIPINWDKVDELLMAGCTGTEVAGFVGVNEDTIYKRVAERYGMCFSAYAAQKKSTGESVLRLHQYLKATGITKKGDNTLLIWLGKQRLGQSEHANESIAPEEILKAFEKLTDQINKAQESRKPWEKNKEYQAISVPASSKEDSTSSSTLASASSMSAMTKPCNESPFL